MRPTLLRRAAWYVARHIPGRARAWSWNNQYERGYWPDAANPPKESIVSFVLREYSRRDSRPLRVLELGCGTGLLVEAIAAERGPHLAWYGVDASSVAVSRARERNNGTARFLAGDVASPSFARAFDPASFDLVVGSEVIYYARDPGRVFGEINGLLAPGGRAIFSTHSATKFRRVLGALARVAAERNGEIERVALDFRRGSALFICEKTEEKDWKCRNATA